MTFINVFTIGKVLREVGTDTMSITRFVFALLRFSRSFGEVRDVGGVRFSARRLVFVRTSLAFPIR